ncbi:MAG TPA: 4-(cytidine 5'-diphospho)-2-C-methyl-D-erythritol kinase [Thermohalobaculum sp.]|nr:4-(cytidine 5'-diphospho)-2-C-methyl-D-erythritol kinase [Thermohalobaculum sp.]
MAAEPDAAEAAPAKVNLFLHLRGRRPDGYHLLDSLAVFPRLGDRLSATRAARLSLSLAGPFGGDLRDAPDNLVLRAARALAAERGVEAGAALVLEKVLPVASGIGGGSADAAAALRLLARLWGVALPADAGLGLGADVPVCLSAPEPRMVSGIGERLTPPPPLPGFWIVLANPGEAVATGAVFAALERRDYPAGPPMPAAGFAGFGDLVGWLARQRNDLQQAATALCPAIAGVLEALEGAALARMSGSGATCFALHGTAAGAEAQAERLARANPGWWVAAAPVAPWPGVRA